MTESSFDASYWETLYGEGKTGWDRGVPHPAVLNWLENGELTTGRIALPGCGNGHEVVELATKGFQVTAIDFAQRPVQRLRDQLKEAKASANIINGDIFEFAPAKQFDAIYEQTCLCAIEPTLRVAYEKTIYNWLCDGGQLFVLFMQIEDKGPRDHPPFHCDLKDMKTIFCESRWLWNDEPPKQYPHPSGVGYEFATTLVRK